MMGHLSKSAFPFAPMYLKLRHGDSEDHMYDEKHGDKDDTNR